MKRIKLPSFGLDNDDDRTTEEYRAYLRSADWAELRAAIIAERGRACESCGRGGKGVTLQLHHLNYDRLGEERDEDLELLCIECHREADLQRAEETRFERGLQTYSFKKYGRFPDEAIEAEFADWLEQKENEW